MKIVLLTMPTVREQDQHDFMNRQQRFFLWLRIRSLVNVVPAPSLLYLAPPPTFYRRPPGSIS